MRIKFKGKPWKACGEKKNGCFGFKFSCIVFQKLNRNWKAHCMVLIRDLHVMILSLVLWITRCCIVFAWGKTIYIKNGGRDVTHGSMNVVKIILLVNLIAMWAYSNSGKVNCMLLLIVRLNPNWRSIRKMLVNWWRILFILYSCMLRGVDRDEAIGRLSWVVI